MKRSRLSIAGLMAVIVLIAVGFAALRNPTVLWASLIFTATVAFLATAILGSIARRGRARMTWAGVAVFGWAYLAMSFGPFPNGNGVDCPPFPTQAVNDSVKQAMQRAEEVRFQQGAVSGFYVQSDSPPQGEAILPYRVPNPSPAGVPVPVAFPPPPGMPLHAVDWKNHRRIGHSLGAILFGLIGAVVGRTLTGRDEPTGETRTTPA